MAKTIAQIENDVLALINNLSQNGIDISLSEGAQVDYLKRMPSLINDAQQEIATIYKKIPAQHVFSQYPVDNLLPNPLYRFDIVPHLNTDITYQVTGAAEYCFEVDYLADIYIEEQVNGIWVDLPSPVHISVASKPNGYQAFKGFIIPSDSTNPVQIRFSGSYAYHIKNVAFFAAVHASADDIPDYQPYNIYDMPSDFYQIMPDGVVFRGNFSEGEPFTKSKPYYWKTPTQIAISYFDKGEYTINYYKYPAVIDGSTATTEVLEISAEAQLLVPYYVAGHLLLDEQPDIGTTLINEYEQKAQLLNGNADTGTTEILSVTGWN